MPGPAKKEATGKKSVRKPYKPKMQKKTIPKECLEKALKILQDPDHEVLKEHSKACEKGMHRHHELISHMSYQNYTFNYEMQLQYARDCLMRRDFHNLSEVLLLFKPRKVNLHLFPIYAKYASICLAYTNQPLLKDLLQSLKCNESTQVALKTWTQISKDTNNARLE